MKIKTLLFMAILGTAFITKPSAASAPQNTSSSKQRASSPQATLINEFYAAPNGSPSGDGSFANPWDLQTALYHPSAVQPGDTIWLRGGTYTGTGTYTSTLTGSLAAPIIVRSYPGEWAKIDTRHQSTSGTDGIEIFGQYTYYWDFEITNSQTVSRGGTDLAVNTPYNKFINLIIHDTVGNSFGRSNEMYGTILYNNGIDGSGGAHHLYIQSYDTDHPTIVEDSILFNGFAFGIHGYASSTSSQLIGVHLIGNIWFNNGVAQSTGELKDNVLIAAKNGPANILFRENLGWAAGPATRSLSLGRYWDCNEDITLIDNYLVGKTWFVNPFTTTVMTGNTFYAIDPANINPNDYPDNTYLSSAPTQNAIFIRPNQYQPGRAHIAVYNWEDLDSVQVDISGVLNVGDAYEVRNAQNYFAAPVASGIYIGGSISLPMTGISPAQPLYGGFIDCPSECTGKAFNVFVLIPVDSTQVFLPFIQK